MSRTWYGLPRPWDAYLSTTFGSFTLIDYVDVHATSADYPQRYLFTLTDGLHQVVRVEFCNITQLEKWCNAQTKTN